jgi:D-serine deaminase-like pyridoxal phosphate-dependent protein
MALQLDDGTPVATPSLVVDEAVLDRNLADVARTAAAAGLALRPHVKTHKSLEIARRQRAVGATGITVATLGEAEVFAGAGFDDVFVAYPLWLDGVRARRLVALAERARMRVGVGSLDGARQLLAGVGARPGLSALIEVDSGHHRSGVAPEHAGEVAAALADGGVAVAGVFTFPGHSYAPDGGPAAAADESAALSAAAQALAAAGVDAPVRSGGSTPSLASSDPGTLTEVRPGVYALGDAQQWELGATAPERIALTVLATVVARYPDRLVTDAGSKVLGADRPAWATGFGRLLDHPEARIVALSEHHSTVVGVDAPAGSTLRVVPNHVCNAVNLVDALVVVRAGGGVTTWPVDARGRNQ